MDVNMPQIDGIAATRLIRYFEECNNLKQIPIFMVSAEVDRRFKRAAFAAGANEYFVKPVRRETLAKCIHIYASNLHTVLVVQGDKLSLDLSTGILTLQGFRPVHTQHPGDVMAIL